MSRSSLVRAAGIDGEWLAKLYWTAAATTDLVTFWWTLVAMFADGTPDCPLGGLVLVAMLFTTGKTLFVTYALRRWLTLQWLRCCVVRPLKIEVSGLLSIFLGILHLTAFVFLALAPTTECPLPTTSKTGCLLGMWGAFTSLVSMLLVSAARAWCKKRELMLGVAVRD